MRGPAYELIFAGLAILALTAGYAWLAQAGVPQPAGVVGQTLGIVGFILMLGAETMYSLRKRWPRFNYGPTSVWLQVHIFTGIVGPYLALLHSGWRFNGLAGVLMLFTAVVVLSGIVGRYLYTAVPRSLAETLPLAELSVERQTGMSAPRPAEADVRSLEATRRLLALWPWFHIPLSAAVFTLAVLHIGGALYYSTFMK